MWECRTGLDCKYGAMYNHVSLLGKRDFMIYEQAEYDIIRVDDASTSVFKLTSTWMKLVGKHSSLSQTCESDHLAALSGLAAIFEPKFLGKHVAGMWTGMLPRALDWFTSQIQERPLTSETIST